MKKSDRKYLKKLLKTPSPTGCEQRIAQVVRDRVAPFATTVETDVMGSVHATVEGGAAAPSLMLAAHMDEVGLMVVNIADDGFLSVAAIGGVDAAILPGLRVGDPITYGVGFERFGRHMGVSRAFDDKCGVWVITRVIEELAAAGSGFGTVTAACTVQEEIGTRGAITSAFGVAPDVAVAFDVTHATDYPGISHAKYGDIKCGGGPVIGRGPNVNPAVYERLVAAAEAAGIPYQVEALPGHSGTDAWPIQVSRSGIPTGLVSVPLRYMHTPTEVICLDDLDACVALFVQFAKDLPEAATFVPGVGVAPADDTDAPAGEE